jgi:hypothetical protein
VWQERKLLQLPTWNERQARIGPLINIVIRDRHPTRRVIEAQGATNFVGDLDPYVIAARLLSE